MPPLPSSSIRAAFLAFLALAPVGTRAQAPGTPDEPAINARPEIKKLVLDGVTSVNKLDLEQSISTQQSACKNVLLEPFCLFTTSPTFVQKAYLDHTELTRDVLRIRVYYWRRGFRDVQVDTAVAPNRSKGVTVTFVVHENQPTLIRRLDIDYDSLLITKKELKEDGLIHAGHPLDLVALDSTRKLYGYDMWGRGYADATVDTAIVIDSVTNTADVTLRLIPNHRTYVGPITVTGLQHVSEKTVLNMVTLHTGGLFKRGEEIQSQRNLYESSLFRLASIRVPEAEDSIRGDSAKKDSIRAGIETDSIKPIAITLTEAPLHDAQLGGGISDIDFLQTQASYTSYDLFGGARRLDITGTVGNLFASDLAGRGPFYDPAAYVPAGDAPEFLQPTWQTSANFTQPSFFSHPADLAGLGVFAHLRTAPGIFVDRGEGATATFTHQFAPQAPVSLTYRYELNRVDAGDVYFCVDYGVCDSTTIGALGARHTLSPLVLTGLVDRSDNPLEPTKGYVARVDIEHASAMTLSDYHYERALLDAAAYTHLGSNVFAGHVQLGIVRALGGGQASDSTLTGVLHPQTRFYAGGATSVRGFADDQLGPRVLTIAPSQLANSTNATGTPCDITSAAIKSCNPNTGGLSDAAFLPQALGGTSLIEGSVEWRFPLPLYQNKILGAVFVDGAIVGRSSLAILQNIQSASGTTGAITPGFGLRYLASVGAIRIDLGFNPSGAENLAVVTSTVVNGQERVVPLTIPRRYESAGTTLLSRLTLHFSVGEAY